MDGYKTIAYELWSQLDRQLPDAIVAPSPMATAYLAWYAVSPIWWIWTRQPAAAGDRREPYGPFAAVLAGRPGQVPGDGSVAFSIAATTASWQGVHALQLTGGAA